VHGGTSGGVKLVVSSDAHHTSGFGVLEFGINQARRGWVQAADVVNTQPFEDLRDRRRLA
jgi:DNA polymerase (family 10)